MMTIQDAEWIVEHPDECAISDYLDAQIVLSTKEPMPFYRQMLFRMIVITAVAVAAMLCSCNLRAKGVGSDTAQRVEGGAGATDGPAASQSGGTVGGDSTQINVAMTGGMAAGLVGFAGAWVLSRRRSGLVTAALDRVVQGVERADAKTVKQFVRAVGSNPRGGIDKVEKVLRRHVKEAERKEKKP